VGRMHGVRGTGSSHFPKTSPASWVGQVARRLTVCLCDENADIFEERMNLYWSYMRSFRGLSDQLTELRSDVVRFSPYGPMP